MEKVHSPHIFSVKASRLAAVIALSCGTISVSSCGSKSADRTLDICVASPTVADEAVAVLRGVSNKFGYRFREYGAEAKADLNVIDANPSVIPPGRPIQADIQRTDGKILLVASNFGSRGEGLRLSFFYYRDEGEGSPFSRAVVSGMQTLPNASLHSRADAADTTPCDAE